jgi:hypothetical protein
MMEKPIQFLPMTSQAAVVRLFEGDSCAVHLATFEYSYQASQFAKALSRQDSGVVAVLDKGRTFLTDAFEGGKKHKGFALQVQIGELAA